MPRVENDLIERSTSQQFGLIWSIPLVQGQMVHQAEQWWWTVVSDLGFLSSIPLSVAPSPWVWSRFLGRFYYHYGAIQAHIILGSCRSEGATNLTDACLTGLKFIFIPSLGPEPTRNGSWHGVSLSQVHFTEDNLDSKFHAWTQNPVLTWPRRDRDASLK